MKFELAKSTFIEPLQRVVNIIEKRQTLPILSHVLIQCSESGLVCVGTDQEIELSARISADQLNISRLGAVTVPGRKLLDIVRHLPQEARITCEADSDRFILRSQRFESQLATLPANEFPWIDLAVIAEEGVKVSSAGLKNLLSRTMFAMAQQDVRYFFNGMLFEFESKLLRCVATNGQRLAIAEQALNEEPGLSRPILPRKGVVELARLLDGAGDDVLLQFTPQHVQVEIGADRFVSKLIDAEYPDYSKAIPQGGDRFFSCSRSALKDALVRTAVLSNEVYKNVRLSLSSGQLEIFTNNPQQEQAIEQITVDYASEPLEIGFNIHFLIEALSVMSGDEVRVELSSPSSPCLLRDSEDSTAQYVISPMVL
jgi:DNA polymerase-3 subunit beta